MEKRLPRLMGAATLALVMSLAFIAAPVGAQRAPIKNSYVLTPEPVWAGITAEAHGNYPGGNEVFDIYVVNSAQPPAGNVTVLNMTLSAPFFTNFGIGLPAVLAPGDLLPSTITLPIPSTFSDNNFTANLKIYVTLWNGTKNIPLTLTGSAIVDLLALPGGNATQTSTTSASGGGSPSGTVSTTLFAAGVAIPSVIVIILLVALVRARGRPHSPGT